MEENKTVQQNKLHYDAFISYRHAELDKFVAENLHKQMEAFRLPKNVAKKRPGQKNKIERVFRDKEELPLTNDLNDPIMAALENSEWLIVICSPRLRESLWCKKEIETFIKMHGRERVLAVLIEGEPVESFPDELLYKTEKITKPDGSVEEIKIQAEPLAADMRGNNKKEILKNMKTEILRLLATMFRLNYDDLRQRHREQRMKRITTISAIGGVVCLVLCIVFGSIAVYMYRQNNIIRELSDLRDQQHEELKYQQALSLAEEARRYMEEDERELAVWTAASALSEYDIYSMPYTPQAHGALIESLRCYDTGMCYQAQYQMETIGIVSAMHTSPDGSLVAVLDEVARLYIWDVVNNEVLATLQLAEDSIYAQDFAFVDNNRIAYQSGNDVVSVYDLAEQKVVLEMDNQNLSAVYVDLQNHYIILDCVSAFEIYDADTYTLISEVEQPGWAADYRVFFAADEAIMAFTRKLETDNRDADYVLFADVTTGEVISMTEVPEFTNFDIKMRDGVAYIAYDWYDDEKSEMTMYLQAYDIVQGTVEWQFEISKTFLEFMEIPIAENAYYLMLATTNSIMLVDMSTGAIVKEAAIEGKPIAGYAYEIENVYSVFTENSKFYYIDEVGFTVTDCSDLFVVKPELIEFYINTENGPVLVPYNTNRVINYYSQTGPDMTPVEWTGREYTGNDIWGDEAKAVLLEYGVADVDLVSGLYYDPDGKYMFVCYKDKRVSVYEVNGELLLSTFEVEELPDTYLGTDSFGNTYLGAFRGGYILSPDKELCTYVYGLKDIDGEAGILYIRDDWGQYYQAPVYSKEDLLQMAAPYMEVDASENISETDSSEG